MEHERTYFVSYAHARGFGQIEILVTGKLIVSKLKDTIAAKNGLPAETIVVLTFRELDPEKEVWFEQPNPLEEKK